MTVFVGTAGWSISRRAAHAFRQDVASLERYASRFAAVEINSSFHRAHRQSTWARWADLVPASFRFAVKMPKAITHQQKLTGCEELLTRFLEEVRPLEGKLSILLVQLPPRLAFDASVATNFFSLLSSLTQARIVCEPRHPSWFEQAPDALLGGFRVARVAADPALVAAGARPGGWLGLSYWRLHGSPHVYRSSYDDGRLDRYADLLGQEGASGREAWCVFDNTASSAATEDALRLQTLLHGGDPAAC
jgi:uncharacterized protein YecE (DUF72 family)